MKHIIVCLALWFAASMMSAAIMAQPAAVAHSQHVTAPTGMQHPATVLGLSADSVDTAIKIQWLQHAIARANQGDVDAQNELGTMYLTGHGVRRDYVQATHWFTMAANQGDRSAQTYLGLMYTGFHGAPLDYDKALLWYAKAANQGFAPAQYALALMYESGAGTPQSYAEALQWYEKAAEQNFHAAQTNLGIMYLNGEGVSQSDVTAAKWFILAKSAGSSSAKTSLRRLESQMTLDEVASAQTAAQAWETSHLEQAR